MNVTRVSPFEASDQTQAQAIKAGAQFEAILLNMVFGDLQKTISQLPGASVDAITKSYDGFGMEALTTALAQNRSIGLGPFISRSLLAHEKQAASGV
jgi:Rod binding domain-containing protein